MLERSLLDYWLIIYERRIAILVVIATAIGSALIIGETVTPIYEARASLYIPAKLGSVSYVGGGSTSTLARDQGAPLAKEADYKPYMGMLKSAQLAEIVHAQYPEKAIIKLLRSDTDFEVTDELVVRVYSRDPDPKLAANVANAYVEGLNTILADSSQAQVGSEPAYIRSALGRVNDEVRRLEVELQRFEEKNHLVNLEAELTTLTAKKSSLQDRADETLGQIAAARGKKLALLQEIKREGQDLELSTVAVTSPLIETLRGQLADAMTRLAQLEPELGSNNIELANLRQRRKELEQQLSEEIKRWVSSRIKPQNTHLETLRQQFIDIVIEEQRLQALSQANTQTLARLQERMSAYPEMKARSAELRSSLDRLQRTRDQLQTNLTEAQLQNDRKMRLVVPLDHAEPPGKPAFPIWWLNLSVALIAGALAGVAYAFLLNYVEETRSVRTLRLVTTILGRS